MISVDVDALEHKGYELRAIAVPVSGVPRILQGEVSEAPNGTQEPSNLTGIHSMFFAATAPEDGRIAWVSNDGSDDEGDGTRERPFKTIVHAAYYGLAGGAAYTDLSFAEVRLLPGTYDIAGFGWPKSSLKAMDGWFTLASDDPGNPAVLNGAGGTPFQHMRVKNCILDLDGMGSGQRILGASIGNKIWFDRCLFLSEFSQTGAGYTSGYRAGQYATHCRAEKVSWGPFGKSMVIDCHVDGLYNDAFNARGIFNCSAKNLDPRVPGYPQGAHSDIWQIWNSDGDIDNVIIHGLEATETIGAQGLFFAGYTVVFKNMSFRDVRIDNTLNGNPMGHKNFYAYSPMRHVLIDDSEFTGGYVDAGGNPYSDGDFTAEVSRFRNVRKLGTSELFLPFPDGPGAGGAWPGFWTGQVPWTSPSTLFEYQSE